MLDGVEVLFHSSIRINKKFIIYIDPYKINKKYNDADFVFITHSHYDHYSEEDLKKVYNKETNFIVTSDLHEKLIAFGIDKSNITVVKPNKHYNVKGIHFSTIPAYNTNKPYHPKENNWIGYIIYLDKYSYYIMGDTDATYESEKIHCDVLFAPVGGVFTMDYKEASKITNVIKPKYAIPIHYGSIVGTTKDANKYIKLLDSGITGKILMRS